MATARITSAIQLRNGNLKIHRAGTLSVEIKGTNICSKVESVTTSSTVPSFPNIVPGEEGWCLVINHGAASGEDGIGWGSDDAGTLRKLGQIEPGEFALFRIKKAQTLNFVADSGTQAVEWVLLSV